MKQTINFSQFCDDFSEDRKNQFSYNGKKALFDYLEEYEGFSGEEIELDTIALCCEYTEYETAIECAKNYFDFALSDENISAEEAKEEALEYLKNRTQVIEFEGGIIIQEF
jgi:hypothetical protein